MCRGSDVVVVGGGNSAGQAAVFLAGQVRKVYLVVRGDDLYKDMSSYLARRIEQTPNIEVLLNTEVRRMSGDGHLGEVELVNNKTGEVRTHQDPGAVQLHRGGAADRLAARRRSSGTPRGSSGPGRTLAQSPHWTAPAAAVPAGDQPPRRVRRRGRALRLGQARRLGRRRGGDGGPVRARVPEGNVTPGGQTSATATRRQPRSRHPRYDGFDQMLVNGAWRHGRGKLLEDRDPYTNDVLVGIPLADERDLDDAFRAAAAAQPAWAGRPAARTGRRAPAGGRDHGGPARRDHRLAHPRVRQHADQGERRVAVSPTQSRSRRRRSRPAADGHILPTDIPGKESRVYRQPVGVVGMISPWNFPFHLSSRSVAPALALGNAVVIKPASDTPVTGGTLLAKIYEEAGLPAGRAQRGRRRQGSAIGDAFVRHPVPAGDLLHRLDRGRPAHRRAGRGESNPQEGRARAGRQLSVRGPRRRGPGARRERRRLRQVPAPGADLHGDQPPDRRREGPRRVRRPLRRPGARAEGRQPRRRRHRRRPADQPGTQLEGL